MTQTLLTTITLSGLGIAFFHAAIPTHWLPFVLTGRAQRWNNGKTLVITMLAGGGHVLFTAALGLLLAWLGIALSEKIGLWLPRLAGGALLVLGGFYLYRQFTGVSHAHSGRDHTHNRNSREGSGKASERQYEKRIHELAEAKEPPRTTDFYAVTTLLALLTFSPCEAFVGFYVVGIRYGWAGFLLLTLVLLIGTVAGMTVFTWLALAGIRKINLGLFERYEQGLVGGLLCIVGALVVLFEK
jgi:nickel/cobalt transporter (NicO) family protein